MNKLILLLTILHMSSQHVRAQQSGPVLYYPSGGGGGYIAQPLAPAGPTINPPQFNPNIGQPTYAPTYGQPAPYVSTPNYNPPIRFGRSY